MPLYTQGAYELEASVIRYDNSVGRPQPNEEPDMYSIYIRFTDQCAHWRADFLDYEDAVRYLTSLKEKSC